MKNLSRDRAQPLKSRKPKKVDCVDIRSTVTVIGMEAEQTGSVINIGGEEEEHHEQAPPIELMEPEPINQEEEENFEIEAILGDEMIDGVIHYHVKWLGFGQEDNTWEPIENLASCKDLIDRYLEEKERKEAEKLAKGESEHDTSESESKSKPSESENDQSPQKKKKHQWDSEDMEFDQPKGNTVSTESEEEIAVKTPQRTSNVVTRLQYQKQFFGSGSSSDVPAAAIFDEEEVDSDNYAEVKRTKKRSKATKAKTTKSRTASKKKEKPVRISSSDDEMDSDDADDDYKRVTGVTIHSNGEIQFEVVRTDGKIRHVAKDDLQKYHTRLYLRFMEKIISPK